MATKRDVASLQQLLTSGVDIMAQMPLASEVLKRVVPSFSLSMIRVDERCAPNEHYSEFFDEFSHELFANAGHAFAANTDDPAAFGNLLKHPRPFGTLIDTPPAYLSGATYEHLFKRNGIHYCLDIAIREPGRPLGILGIFREEKTRPFTRSDLVHIAQIYPYLVHALAAEPLPTDFDEEGTGLIVCDRAGTIRWASSAARAWLGSVAFGRERRAFFDGSRLPEACRALVARLSELQAAPRHDTEMLAAPELTLTIPGGRLRLRAYGLSGLDASSEALVGVQLSLEVDKGLRTLALLETSPLSPQQRKIAYLLARGRSTREIAEALALRPSTLKSYQKELYARMGVRGSGELVRLLESRSRGVCLDLSRHLPSS